MNCTKLTVNAYTQPRMKAFELRAGLPSTISDQMLKEVNRPPMAEYYAVEEDREWLGRMRLTTGGLNAVLVDALDVLPGQPNEAEVVSLLLEQARAVAHASNRVLTVLTANSEERWAAYGFKAATSALTLA